MKCSSVALKTLPITLWSSRRAAVVGRKIMHVLWTVRTAIRIGGSSYRSIRRLSIGIPSMFSCRHDNIFANDTPERSRSCPPWTQVRLFYSLKANLRVSTELMAEVVSRAVRRDWSFHSPSAVDAQGRLGYSQFHSLNGSGINMHVCYHFLWISAETPDDSQSAACFALLSLRLLGTCSCHRR